MRRNRRGNQVATNITKIGLVLGLICFLLIGCRSVKTVEVEKVRDVWHNTIDTVRDSVYRDVWHNSYVKGDSVFIERTEYVYRDRWRVHRDTLIERDTIPKVVTVEVERSKTLKERIADALFYPLGFLFVLIIILIVIYLIRKRLV